jgi:hypothetical protein
MTTTLNKATIDDVDSLTLDEARMLSAKLDCHIARNTPLSEGAIKVCSIVSEAMGGMHPVEQVAETLGIDLATAAAEDAWRLSAFHGARMGDQH